ncbi:MAG TPA: hypothetical protein PLQ87_02670 [Phycisphaerae bacterium]|nr:hypothetical protein [Phycisphaerae bacterium]
MLRNRGVFLGRSGAILMGCVLTAPALAAERVVLAEFFTSVN